MVDEIEITVKGASAQDLYYIEREVPGTKVIEESHDDNETRFGMPGVVEAVVLVGAISAAVGTILYITKTRESGEIIIQKKKLPDGTAYEEINMKFDKEESPETLLSKIDDLIKAIGTSVSA